MINNMTNTIFHENFDAAKDISDQYNVADMSMTLVQELTDTELAVLVLFAADFRQHQIGSILNISRTTVWTTKKRALDKIRQYFMGLENNK